MPNPQTLLLHLLLPALVTAVLLLLVARAWRKPSATAVRIAWAVALAAGYAAGHFRVNRFQAFDPIAQRYWLVILGGAMALMLIIGTLLRGKGMAATVLAALPVITMPALVLQYLGGWSTQQWVIWSATIAVVGVAMLLAMRALESRGDIGLPMGLSVTAMAWGVYVWSCGAMIDGQLSMTLAAAMAGGTAACFLLPPAYRHAGSASIGMLLLLGQLLLGYFYVYGMDDPTSDRWVRTIIVAASPLIMWLPQFVWPRDTRPVGRVVFIAVLLALVVGPPAREYYEQVVGDNTAGSGSAWDTNHE